MLLSKISDVDPSYRTKNLASVLLNLMRNCVVYNSNVELFVIG